jgi:tritrans,polycis-undecaprenyl-diphosphate synthase [geranylgeranyl-diphosphate specific]
MIIETLPARLLGIPKIRSLITTVYERQLLSEILANGKIPNHVGIILDGNRRFATKQGLPPVAGHIYGAEKLEEVLEWCRELGIKHVTVYSFSTENFQRSSEEVRELMRLFAEKFRKAAADERVHKYKIKIRAIGDLTRLPPEVQQAIKEAEEATNDYDGYTLNIAIAYGGRTELAHAVRKICEKIEKGELRPHDVNEKTIEENLYTAGLPDPDLIIRTSGEERLSGFLLWQSAYSELYFCEADWPSFSKLDFLRAIRNFQLRERRFGK